MKKITVIGDIMVEPPFMEQVAKDGKYNFVPSFVPLKTLLNNSDYIIGNLETPLAGEDAGYTDRIVSFNSPDSLVDALKELKIDVVSTVNNHCVDRDYAGLVRTLEVLDQNGIAHTGTYPEGYTGDRIHYFTLGDTKIALIAYTYATNHDINGVFFEGERAKCINALRPLRNAHPLYKRMPDTFYTTIAYIEELLGRKMLWEETIKLKLAMDLPVPIIDNSICEEEQDEYFKGVEADYQEARKNADIVLFYPHVGGQFNELPGKFTQRLMGKCAALGFDAVFAAHSHTSQRAEFLSGMPCFYSMGNVSMSPGTFYSVSECLPEYGLAAHLYIADKSISKVTFSIFKMVEEGSDPLRVIPVHDLVTTLEGEKREKLIQDVAAVYERVTLRKLPDQNLKAEYDLV